MEEEQKPAIAHPNENSVTMKARTILREKNDDGELHMTDKQVGVLKALVRHPDGDKETVAEGASCHPSYLDYVLARLSPREFRIFAEAYDPDADTIDGRVLRALSPDEPVPGVENLIDEMGDGTEIVEGEGEVEIPDMDSLMDDDEADAAEGIEAPGETTPETAGESRGEIQRPASKSPSEVDTRTTGNDPTSGMAAEGLNVEVVREIPVRMSLSISRDAIERNFGDMADRLSGGTGSVDTPSGDSTPKDETDEDASNNDDEDALTPEEVMFSG